MKRYLLIAHYEGDHTPVVEFVRQLAQTDSPVFDLIVPATPPPEHTWTWSEQQAYDVAKRRLDAFVSEFKQAGVSVNGTVSGYDSLSAIDDALQKQEYDELIVATPPDGVARTSFDSVEQHVKRLRPTPIQHIVIPDAKPIASA